MPLILLALCLLIASLLGFVGQNDWLFDLCAAFRMQYTILALFLLLLSVLRRQWTAFWLFAATLGVNLSVILPFYMPPSQVSDLKAQPTYTLLHSNVFKRNRQYGRFIARVRQLNPDIVAMVEVTRTWHAHLLQDSVLKRRYPHRFYDANSELLLFSRFPLLSPRLRPVENDASLALLSAQIRFPDQRRLTLVVFHPAHGTSDEESLAQRLLIAQLLLERASLPNPLLLVGDYNLTPWSSQYRRLEEEAHLKDASRGFGVQPTWPVGFGPLMIPIDHMMRSEGVAVKKIHPLLPTGSDHLPLYAEFALTSD